MYIWWYWYAKDFIPWNEQQQTDRMDQLPCELLHHIFCYIEQPLDLFRISCVCSRWQSLIMDDEYFLNQWFSRSLESCPQPFDDTYLDYIAKYSKESIVNINHSLFPINFQSSERYLLPYMRSRESSDREDFIVHGYPLSLFESSHSFSFWLFLPHQCGLNMRISNFHVNGLVILLNGNEIYYFDNGKCASIANRWIHIVLTKIDSHSNYRLWIDGQSLLKSRRYHSCFLEMETKSSLINFVLLHSMHNNALEASSKIRIAAFNALKRCLTLVEIRAIHQQQTSIKQVKVGKARVMQNYSTLSFLLKCTFLDSVFHADHEYVLTFSIWQSLHREKCKILSRCRNLQKTPTFRKATRNFLPSHFSISAIWFLNSSYKIESRNVV